MSADGLLHQEAQHYRRIMLASKYLETASYTPVCVHMCQSFAVVCYAASLC